MSETFTRHPSPLPIEYQYELALLNEECGEVIQIAGKTLRFGWSSTPPNDIRTNLDLLHEEIGDVLAATEMACSRGLLNRDRLEQRKTEKLAKLAAIAPMSIIQQQLSVANPSIPATLTNDTPVREAPRHDWVQSSLGAAIVGVIILVLFGVGWTAFHKDPEPAQEPVPVVAAPPASTVALEPVQQAPGSPVSAIKAAALDCQQKAKALGSPGTECNAIVALANSQ
jgi:NTP pyrophosphatase (non-canonical NTP hydrolase)